MKTPIVIDISHLASRASVNPHTGIDRVDIAYARAISRLNTPHVVGLCHSLLGQIVVSRDDIRKLIDEVDDHAHWRAEFDQSEGVQELRRWLARSEKENEKLSINRISNNVRAKASWKDRMTTHVHSFLTDKHSLKIPQNSIYLNVAPHGIPAPQSFRWLEKRDDVKAVFFIHDLLPIDRPELFPSNWLSGFERMVSAVTSRAAGFIVASEVMKSRVTAEVRKRGRAAIPIHVCALPPSFENELESALQVEGALQMDGALAPYFVTCGTLEPRKNHLLLLNSWLELIEKGTRVPRLILVGKRGWGNQDVFALLDSKRSLRGRVFEASGLSDTAKILLLRHACGALIPSFDEGYGFPVVEALSLGLPTAVSDIPIFHEVSQGQAIFCSPFDKKQWLTAIVNLSERSSTEWRRQAQRASDFQSPKWPNYFRSVLSFLSDL